MREAIELSNDTIYGLSAAVFGAKVDSRPVARLLEAGSVYVNGVDLVGEVGLDAEKNYLTSSSSELADRLSQPCSLTRTV